MKFLRLNIFMILLLLGTSVTFAQKNKSYQLYSADGKTVLKIEAGEKLQWSVTNNSAVIIAPSAISTQLKSGEALGNKAAITSAKK